MKFDEYKIIKAINESWSWIIPEVTNVLLVNSMGNCFVEDVNHNFWRICPEELFARLEAENQSELEVIFSDEKYKQDWQLLDLIDPAEEHFGKLEVGQCYCMIMPAVLGGEYSISNLRLGSVYEYLKFTGELAFKTKDLKSGDKVEIVIDE